jgi:DNA replication and repair protein RecF
LNLPLVQFDCQEFKIKAISHREESISLSKSLKGPAKITLNEQRCQRMSELTQLLPCQIVHQDLFQIIDAAAETRRRLLDWGVFYEMPEYASLWQDFKRVLLQRNGVLKQQGSRDALAFWNKSFVQLSERITELRLAYLQKLNVLFQQKLPTCLAVDCHIDYYNGWDKSQTGKTLADVLEEQEGLDRKRLYTNSGPHHADLGFVTAHGRGKWEWSRGQQKMILVLLKLAQVKLLAKPCLFLLDDLAAELDEEHLDKLYQQVFSFPGQFFLTALNDATKNKAFFVDSRWFYLENGQITRVVDL